MRWLLLLSWAVLSPAQGPCDPASNWQDGVAYCTDYQNPCQVDCQTDISSDGNQVSECSEYRCDDVSGYSYGGACYDAPPPHGVKSNFILKLDCWATQRPCPTCPAGYRVVGCSRVSPGSCQLCPNFNRFVLTVNYFQPGTCNLLPCSAVAKGQFISSQCTISSDVNTTGCYYYEPEVGPGNPGSPRSQLLGDTQNRSYCPGNGAVVTLPANSRPSDDYSGFVCLDGYLQTGASCQACAAGSACLYGQSYQCPLRYYSQGTSNAYCTRCTTSCPGNNYFPVMCPVGGTQDTSCIACGMCSINPQYGLTCDETPHETAKLPWKCVPLKSSGAVAVCDPTVSPRAPA